MGDNHECVGNDPLTRQALFGESDSELSDLLSSGAGSDNVDGSNNDSDDGGIGSEFKDRQVISDQESTDWLQRVFDGTVELSEEAFRNAIERKPSLVKQKYKTSCLGPGGAYAIEVYALWKVLASYDLGYSSFSTIKLLSETCPKSALEDTDVNKMTPLHLACKRGFGLETVQLLGSLHPASITAKAWFYYSGYTPLHVACRHGSPLEVIQWLVEQQPDLLEETTELNSQKKRRRESHEPSPPRHGHTPFQLACLFGASLDVVQFLAEQRPSCLHEKTLGGDTALHLVCRMPQKPLQCRMVDPEFNTCVQTDLIKFLADKNPSALQELGYEGDTPVMAAKKQNAPDHLIALLTSFNKK